MQNTREIAKEYRMSHWAGIMRERTESGLSIRAFCAREGMHVNRYHYWQRRLRSAAMEYGKVEPNYGEPKLYERSSVNSAVSAAMPGKVEAIEPVPTGWTQVVPLEESNKSIAVKTMNSPEVTIEIGKCRVSANDSTDTELLAKVCKMLVSLC